MVVSPRMYPPDVALVSTTKAGPNLESRTRIIFYERKVTVFGLVTKPSRFDEYGGLSLKKMREFFLLGWWISLCEAQCARQLEGKGLPMLDR